MELVGDTDDNGVNVRVGQHLLVVGVSHLWFPFGDHPLTQVVRQVADRVQVDIPGLAAGVEMRDLADRSAAEHTHTESLFVFLHASSLG